MVLVRILNAKTKILRDTPRLRSPFMKQFYEKDFIIKWNLAHFLSSFLLSLLLYKISMKADTI